MTKLLNLIFIVVLLVTKTMAQDIQFSQFYNFPAFSNPAYCGIHQQSKIGVVYRNQYSKMPSAYQTYGFYYDALSYKLHGSVGLFVVKDEMANGIIQNQKLNVSYAYQGAINKKMAFQFGLGLAYHYNYINTSKIIVLDMINPQTGEVFGDFLKMEDFANTKTQFIDFNTGLVFYNKKFYAGLAAQHLNQSNQGYKYLSNLPLLINFQGGYIFKANNQQKDDSWYFSPNILFQTQQAQKQLTVSGIFGMGAAQAGAGLRHTLKNTDAAILQIGFSVQKLRVSYSLDIGLSKYNLSARNTHEIAIQYFFPKKTKTFGQNEWGAETKSTSGRIKCPKFFR